MSGRSRVVTLVVSSIALAFAFAAPAGAGRAPVTPLTVVKTVSGPVPEGTTFTATIECDSDIIIDGGNFVETATVTFDADGQSTSPDSFDFDGSGTCTVTETATGGAATTTYSCDSEVAEAGAQQELELCGSDGPQDDPITINPQRIFGGSITVTIANTFEAAPTTTTTTTPVKPVQPAAAVAAAPTFTG